jgi:hypothetical protein
MNVIEIAVGQVWKDCDPRIPNRYVRVTTMGATHVDCKNIRTGKITRIAKARMQPEQKRYMLAFDAGMVREIENQTTLAARETNRGIPAGLFEKREQTVAI